MPFIFFKYFLTIPFFTNKSKRKFNHANPSYPINECTNSNNNVSAIPTTSSNSNSPSSGTSSTSTSLGAQNESEMNCMDSNEFRNMDEEEDDVDSLNINFDDVNDQSDIDDYYNNCSEQSLNANQINTDLNNNNCSSKNENAIYEMSQHYNHHFSNPKPINTHHITTQNQIPGNKRASPTSKINPCTYMNSSSILESVISNEINSSVDSAFGIPNSGKPNNRNIHCVKEKIRRDRIKMSCNQLRKLVPNVSGFKTDMASLLETSVLWAQLINSNVPEQYLNNIKAKLASLATLKNTNQIKSMQQMQQPVTPTGTSPNVLNNQKYKANYEYLIAKNQQEILANQQQQQQQQQQHQQLATRMLSSPVDLLNGQTSIAHGQQMQHMDISNLCTDLNSLTKPNAWLPYSFQLNNETTNNNNNTLNNPNNNPQKILANIADHQTANGHVIPHPHAIPHPNHPHPLVHQNPHAHAQLAASYNEYIYDKLIKKSPSNTNFNAYER